MRAINIKANKIMDLEELFINFNSQKTCCLLQVFCFSLIDDSLTKFKTDHHLLQLLACLVDLVFDSFPNGCGYDDFLNTLNLEYSFGQRQHQIN